MGARSFDQTDWTKYRSYQSSVSHASSASQIFASQGMHQDMDPAKFSIRESRHSAANPRSTPICLFLDVTGSMGQVAVEIAKNGMGEIIKGIFERKPVTDPHVMFGAIGDVFTDRAPLQASQFEADITMLDQLQKLYVEGAGGGNGSESYCLAWHLAAFHTSTDAFEKDGRKGFLFTVGDEGVPPDFTAAQLRQVFGHGDEPVFSNKDLLARVSEMYHVFHLIIEEGGYMQHSGKQVVDGWRNLLDERALLISDYTKLAEVIVSTMQVVAGDNKAAVINSWTGNTGLVVQRAIGDLVVADPTAGGLVRF